MGVLYFVSQPWHLKCNHVDRFNTETCFDCCGNITAPAYFVNQMHSYFSEPKFRCWVLRSLFRLQGSTSVAKIDTKVNLPLSHLTLNNAPTRCSFPPVNLILTTLSTKYGNKYGTTSELGIDGWFTTTVKTKKILLSLVVFVKFHNLQKYHAEVFFA